MKPYKQENGMQTAELNWLRKRVKDLEAKSVNTTTVQPVVETKVEHKIDVKAIGTLRITLVKLLTAIENYTGPEKQADGSEITLHKPTTELRTAMESARKLVRPKA